MIVWITIRDLELSNRVCNIHLYSFSNISSIKWTEFLINSSLDYWGASATIWWEPAPELITQQRSVKLWHQILDRQVDLLVATDSWMPWSSALDSTVTRACNRGRGSNARQLHAFLTHIRHWYSFILTITTSVLLEPVSPHSSIEVVCLLWFSLLDRCFWCKY